MPKKAVEEAKPKTKLVKKLDPMDYTKVIWVEEPVEES
jgi:hypothetical protein